MISEKKKWMTYTYFNRDPRIQFRTTHLFSFTKKKITGMIRHPFPTMTVDLHNPAFVDQWSESTRTKIKRAEKETLIIVRDNSLLNKILHLFNSTAGMKGLRGYQTAQFASMPFIQCNAIMHENNLLAGHVWLVDETEKRALLYVNASNHQVEDKSLVGRAHYYLLWQDGLFLRQMGMETMDLMGYETDSPDSSLKGVYQWKEGTHGREEMLWHYYPAWFFLLRKLRNMVSG